MAASEETLILHRGVYYVNAPSPSPFVLKLETWFRMNSVTYVVDSSLSQSQHPVTGKTPWVEWRGQKIPDSSIIIQTLTRDLNLNPDRNVSAKDLAVGRAFQKLLEEELYWCAGLWRTEWSDNGHQIAVQVFGKVMSFFVLPFYRRKYRNYAYGHGIGRLDKEAVLKIARDDLQALSDYLGDKNYLLGGETPSTIDCSMFGMLGQMLFGMPDSCFAEWMHSEFRNLKHFCDRMRSQFWPDWAELCRKAETESSERS